MGRRNIQRVMLLLHQLRPCTCGVNVGASGKLVRSFASSRRSSAFASPAISPERSDSSNEEGPKADKAYSSPSQPPLDHKFFSRTLPKVGSFKRRPFIEQSRNPHEDLAQTEFKERPGPSQTSDQSIQIHPTSSRTTAKFQIPRRFESSYDKARIFPNDKILKASAGSKFRKSIPGDYTERKLRRIPNSRLQQRPPPSQNDSENSDISLQPHQTSNQRSAMYRSARRVKAFQDKMKGRPIYRSTRLAAEDDPQRSSSREYLSYGKRGNNGMLPMNASKAVPPFSTGGVKLLRKVDKDSSKPWEWYSNFLSTSSVQINTVRPSHPPLASNPLDTDEEPAIARLAHGLDRVLFNPGVHWVQDPRSKVFNFPSSLTRLPEVEEFDFSKIPQYTTSSKDKTLHNMAIENNKTFYGSTSTVVPLLCQIYFWLSKGRDVNLGMLSKPYQSQPADFAFGLTTPCSIMLRKTGGKYAIDQDKSNDVTEGLNILADLGTMMEKLLTTDAKEFSRFLKNSPEPAESKADFRQAYNYITTGNMVIRSQLDAFHDLLPNRSFDVKTRGTVAIRSDRLNYKENSNYEISSPLGLWNSFEREYYDMIRSAFLKYQFQARIGNMDGCMVAYHSTAQFFGFQYIPISEMDEALFGSTTVGESVFKMAIAFLEKILHRASICYPGHSVKVTVRDCREKDALHIFVEAPDSLKDNPQVPPITMMKMFSANFVGGDKKPTHQVNLKEHETWTVGYKMYVYRGSKGQFTTPWMIKEEFLRTVDLQRSFNRLMLPSDVSELDLAAAYEAASQSGDELESRNLAARFPARDGLQYVSRPTMKVRYLRNIAKEAAARRLLAKLRTDDERVLGVNT